MFMHARATSARPDAATSLSTHHLKQFSLWVTSATVCCVAKKNSTLAERGRSTAIGWPACQGIAWTARTGKRVSSPAPDIRQSRRRWSHLLQPPPAPRASDLEPSAGRNSQMSTMQPSRSHVVPAARKTRPMMTTRIGAHQGAQTRRAKKR